MIIQTELNFTTSAPINTEKFSRQNKIVADRLLSGKSINVIDAINHYHIFHLHSRIAEVRKAFKRAGIKIYSRYIKVGDTDCKEYSLEEFKKI